MRTEEGTIAKAGTVKKREVRESESDTIQGMIIYTRQ